MKTDTQESARREPWFPPEQQEHLRDFWVVYNQHYQALQESTMRLVEKHEQLAPLLRSMTPEQLAAQQAQSREQMRQGIEGNWGPYEENIHMQGAIYARMGFSFSVWYDLMSAFAADLIPLLVSAYSSEPTRLSNTIVAFWTFMDRAMSTTGQRYLDTKEELIREAEARHSQILEVSLDPIISVNDRGLITEFNPAAERTFGYPQRDVIGKQLIDTMIPERFREPNAAELEKYLTTGEGPLVGKRVELIANRADGSEFPVELSIVALKSASSGVQFTGFARDLSESKKAEQSRMLWAHVFEHTQFGLVISESETNKIHSANDAYAKMLGYTPEEIAGRPISDFVTPDTSAGVSEISQIIQERGHLTFESMLLRKEKTELPALISSSTLPTRPGEPSLRLSTVIDITERKELDKARTESVLLLERNRRAEEASRLKSEFLANMSHELRTPLNSIIGFAELLHDGEVGPIAPKQQEFLGDILTSGRHLLQLINDVLDLSKVEAGKMEFHPEPLDLRNIIAEVLSLLRTPAANKKIQVEATVPDGMGEIILDSSRLKQVLYNYLSNALKFTPERGKVTVRVVESGAAFFRLEVEDTGIGIAARDLGRLFAEFQQLDSSAAKTHRGTGLGLALTKRLVEAQGGTVGATSRLGEGSLFYAVLPRCVAGRSRRAWAGDSLSLGVSPILVVEDDPQDQATIAQTLVDAGYAIEVASTGAEAIEKCRSSKYRAVTLDLLLPDMSGLDVLRAVRAGDKNPEVPVMVLTVVAERIAAGFFINDHLTKPVDGEALLRSLHSAGVGPAVASAVLVVDNDPGSLKLMGAVLEQLGFQPSCYTNGRQALESLKQKRPAAIVLDLLMPEFDGFQFLASLREAPENARIPVVIWTMKDLANAELELLRASASAIITKGGGSIELTATLRACLGEPTSGGVHGG